jgi:hypothetical protein
MRAAPRWLENREHSRNGTFIFWRRESSSEMIARSDGFAAFSTQMEPITADNKKKRSALALINHKSWSSNTKALHALAQ